MWAEWRVVSYPRIYGTSTSLQTSSTTEPRLFMRDLWKIYDESQHNIQSEAWRGESLRTPVSLVLSLCQMCLFWNNRIWACDWGHETWPGRSTAWAPSAGWTMIMIVWLLGREGENKIQFCLYCTVETKLSRYWQRWNWVGIYGGLDIFIWIYFYTLATLHPAQPRSEIGPNSEEFLSCVAWSGELDTEGRGNEMKKEGIGL